MLEVEEQELLRTFAYRAWVERGMPIGSPEIDWKRAQEMLRAHHARGVEVLDAALAEQVADAATLPKGRTRKPKIVGGKLTKKTLVSGAATKHLR